MTQREMEEEIMKRTGIPLPAVQLMMNSLKEVMAENLVRQQEVVFRGLFRITCSARQHSSFTSPPGAENRERKTVVRLMLGIKPIRAFRLEMNSWTNTLSSWTTTT